MGKLSCRACAIVLLVVWCGFLSSADFNSQYRSMEFNSQDRAEITFFILYVVIAEIGKKIDKSYRCPDYCEVKHEHIYREKAAIPVDSTKYFEKVLASNN